MGGAQTLHLCTNKIDEAVTIMDWTMIDASKKNSLFICFSVSIFD